MFWQLLLAHFIADYQLQPTWMVRNKTSPGVRLLHVLTHFLVMLAVLLPAVGRWWLYALIIAALHYAIDTGKTWLAIRRPRWVVGPYLVDQALHILSIGLVSLWASNRISPPAPYLSAQVAIISTGFLLATYVYLITERVFIGFPSARAGGSDTQAWERLFIRAGLLAALLLAWNWRIPPATSLAILLPYSATGSGLRALLVDLLVTFLTAALVIFLNRSV